ncbi:MAG: hypothetical protein AABX77_00335 [Nanoarchaeota archaeon]
MFRIKKVGILNLAYTVTLVYFVLGIVLGIVLAVLKANPGTVISGSIGQDLTKITYAQIVLIYPVAYAIGGFVVSIVVGFLYNTLSKLTGGVAVHLVKDSGSERVFSGAKKK